MAIFKTIITSVNYTILKVNKNENALRRGLIKSYSHSTHEFSKFEKETENVN
jgi:hypothetical protein